ncbi:thiosulfate sulfurtransferase activity protein [Coemansia erecta]|uniref:Heat shock protein 67B2 n=1 Tax=Coemansia asiatica TaxID=1052880 RepID=A0A9W7XNK4_9FUNG|nr:Heat shock protein 67B2 [Coemansia asiatica]KAJ2858132.1 thiosulfate sulfurtransferase activity protein [Coemansia erecta]KAJ2879566.1 Thiosulfate sulfurtransferase/rhodanese-like domain-containing protein 3 [Coemansia asiatica]
MSSNVQPISFETVKSISEGNSHDGREIVIVDVRNPGEFSGGSIPKAINIPLPILSQELDLSPEAFKSKYEVDLPKPNSAENGIAVHCQMGGRAAKAANTLESKGYTENLYIYKPGYSEFSSKI